MSSAFNSFDESPVGGAPMETPLFARGAPGDWNVEKRDVSVYIHGPVFRILNLPYPDSPTNLTPWNLNLMRLFHSRTFSRQSTGAEPPLPVGPYTVEIEDSQASTTLQPSTVQSFTGFSPEPQHLFNNAGFAINLYSNPPEFIILSSSPTSGSTDHHFGAEQTTETRGGELDYTALRNRLEARVLSEDFSPLWTAVRNKIIYFDEFWTPPGNTDTSTLPAFTGDELSFLTGTGGIGKYPSGIVYNNWGKQTGFQNNAFGVVRAQLKGLGDGINYFIVESPLYGQLQSAPIPRPYKLLGQGFLAADTIIEVPLSTLVYHSSILGGTRACAGGRVEIRFALDIATFLANNVGYLISDWA